MAETTSIQTSKTSVFKAQTVLDYLESKKRLKQFPFKKSGLGSSGLTFLPNNVLFNYVIKWQKDYQTEAEHLCSRFYQRAFSHLSIPNVELINHSESQKKMRSFFSKYSVPDIQNPLIMDYKQGSNLINLAKNGKFFQLPPNEIEKLFRTFGEVAGYDLLIANCDRFLPDGFRGEIDKEYKINGGNIMIELEVDSVPLKVKTIHVIDNAPHFISFLTTAERKDAISDSESDQDYYGGDLFGNESEESSADDVSEDSFEEIDPKPEREADFHYFIKGKDKELKSMVEQICIGIRNELSETLSVEKESVTQFFEKQDNKEAMQVGLLLGLRAAQEKIQSVKIEEIKKVVFNSESYRHKNSATLGTFIITNLTFAQKSKI